MVIWGKLLIEYTPFSLVEAYEAFSPCEWLIYAGVREIYPSSPYEESGQQGGEVKKGEFWTRIVK